MKQHNYRETLQNRTIKPSSGSWEKLNTKLTEHENKKTGRNWLFFKVASVILIFISVGFYFLEETDDMINSPIIVSPTLKEKLNTVPENNNVIQTEIAVTPGASTIIKEPIYEPNKAVSNTVKIDFTEPMDKKSNSSNKVNELAVLDSVTEVILLTEVLNSDEQFIDEEVEKLLNESKIKLIVNGQISSKKVVDANVLLNSVEEDLYKDLKQKLIEKIANKLKNPKEVITSREN
jgi:hypothetical protein